MSSYQAGLVKTSFDTEGGIHWIVDAADFKSNFGLKPISAWNTPFKVTLGHF